MPVRMWSEFVIVLMSGGAPLLGAFLLGEQEGVENTLSSLIANSGFVIYYNASIFSIHVCVELFDRYFIVRSSTGSKLLDSIKNILSEVGAGLVGMMRAVTGVLLTFPVIWYCGDPATFDTGKSIYFLVVGFIGYVDCLFVSLVSGKIRGWENREPSQYKFLL